MEYQRLNQTDFNISRVGFGALAIGGFHYGETKDNESILAVKKALELGINFFDTADIYGFGHSEKILSEALGDKLKEVIISTKVGVRWDKKKNKSYYDLSPDYIRKAAEKSIKNLGIKTIPLYQIHYPDKKINPVLTMAVLNELKKKKKIKHIGCSNFEAEDITKYQKYGRIESIQLPYNLIDQKSEKLIFLAFKKWKMGVIVYSSLAQGLLTGKYDKNSKFSANDRRNKSRYFQKKVLEKIPVLLAKMKEIGSRYDKTIAQVALRWILDNSFVACVLVGAKTPEEIEEAAGASGWKMLEKERKELTEIGKEIWQTTKK